VYATVFLRVPGDEEASMPAGKDDDTLVGVLMDKYEASLENLDELNIKKLFIEHDTEDALVDLYAHAAAYVRTQNRQTSFGKSATAASRCSGS
jgi:hypothetical protein